MDVPYFWNAEEQEWLKGSQVEENTEELRSSLADEFDQLKEAGWDSVLPAGSFTLAVCMECATAFYMFSAACC
jgi:hypothetical protein